MPELFVFKAGAYPQGEWPVERCQRLVDAYNPNKNLEAPVVIGHKWNQTSDSDQFAHGWVKSLRMDKDGKVYATVEEFSKEAEAAIKENKLRYVSAEIFEFDKLPHSADPPYLKSLALLGRDAPAVAGTKLPAVFQMFKNLLTGGESLSADEESHVSTFSRRLNDEDIKSLSVNGGQSIQREDFAMGKTAEELEKELEKSQAQAAAFQRELSDLKNAGRKTDAESFFGKLRDEGKLPPALFEKAVALDAGLGEDARKEYRALFSALETKADLSGKHAADKSKAPNPAAGKAGLSAQVRAFQAEHQIATFEEAAIALHAQKPELFKEGDDE
jgi:hypothetical protein